MASAAEEAVAAALEAAAAGESAESPTASEDHPVSTPEAKPEAKPEAAAVKDPKGVKEKGSEKGPVPYDRFSEVVAEKNSLAEKAKASDEKVRSAHEREDALRARLVQLEQEKAILDQVRGMATDPDMKAHVEAIDKKLRGVEEVKEAVEKGEISDAEATKRVEKLVKDVDEKVDDFRAEQRVKELWEAADSLATQMLDSLPDDYTDQDKATLGQIWNNRVDWKTIDEKGEEAIAPKLKESFVEVIKEYGEPRGAIAKRVKDETIQQVPESARPRTPEDTVKGILEKDWAKVEEGKPVLSDDEFASDLGQLLKATHAG